MSDRQLEELLGNHERQIEARALLREQLDANPTTLGYLKWQAKLPAAAQSRAISCIASFTIETIQPFLEVEAYLSGWRPALSFVQYGQWRNALVDPGAQGIDGSEACVLLLHTDEVFPRNTVHQSDDAIDVAAELTGLIDAFRSRCATPMFVGVASALLSRSAFAYGDVQSHGESAAVVAFRSRLAAHIAELDDVHMLDLAGWTDEIGSGWHDPKGYLANLSLISHRALPNVARGIARSLGCLFRPRRKLLVLDLDNTLWGGIVGENGPEGIDVGEDWPGSAYVAFQNDLRAIRESGVLLAINSKNNEADARAVFESRPEMVLGWDDFAARRINWENKAANLVGLADELGFGLDSVVFADDSPAECALVRTSLPQVEVVELGDDASQYTQRILSTGAFDTLRLSREDTQRADGYQAERARAAAQAEIANLDTFYAGLELRFEIRPVDHQTIERAHQLFGKTNQFNLSLERRSRKDVVDLAANERRLFIGSLTDRFGDYGIVAVMHVRESGDALLIEDLLISCRALGRLVEETLLAFARCEAERRAMKRLSAQFVAGPRNQQVPTLFDRSGFTVVERDDAGILFTIDLDDDCLPWPEHVAVDTNGQKAEAS